MFQTRQDSLKSTIRVIKSILTRISKCNYSIVRFIMVTFDNSRIFCLGRDFSEVRHP